MWSAKEVQVLDSRLEFINEEMEVVARSIGVRQSGSLGLSPLRPFMNSMARQTTVTLLCSRPSATS